MTLEGKTVDEALAALEGEDKIVEGDDTPMEAVRAELEIGDSVDPLTALLDAPLEAPTAEVYIKRLGAHFTVQAITDDREYERLVEQCTSYVRARRGQGRTREVDGRRLGRLTVANYCTSPAFHRRHGQAEFEQLAGKFDTEEPDVLVDRALLMGEVDLLADKILDLSGFEDDGVETAKN